MPTNNLHSLDALLLSVRDFAMAEKRGAEILLPHAKYFAADDIQKLNTIIRENAHDQILHASQNGRR
jgi:hypothetical protein